MSTKYMLHLTSERNWEEIQKSKKICTYSRPNPLKIKADLNGMPDQKGYVVGIPEDSINAWNASGLMPSLLRHTEGEVCLKMPITRDAYLREHAHTSPKKLIEKYGENVYQQYFEENIGREDPRIEKAFVNYIESTIPFLEYDGTYEVPEIWLPEPVSIDNITCVDMPEFIQPSIRFNFGKDLRNNI